MNVTLPDGVRMGLLIWYKIETASLWPPMKLKRRCASSPMVTIGKWKLLGNLTVLWVLVFETHNNRWKLTEAQIVHRLPIYWVHLKVNTTTIDFIPEIYISIDALWNGNIIYFFGVLHMFINSFVCPILQQRSSKYRSLGGPQIVLVDSTPPHPKPLFKCLSEMNSLIVAYICSAKFGILRLTRKGF